VGLHRENERRAAPCRAERPEEMRRKHTPLTPLPTIAGTTRVNSGPTTVGRGGMGKGEIGWEGRREGGTEGERQRKREKERSRARRARGTRKEDRRGGREGKSGG